MKQGLPRVQISMMNVYICVYLCVLGTPAAFTTAYSHRVRRALPLDIVTGFGPAPGLLYTRLTILYHHLLRPRLLILLAHFLVDCLTIYAIMKV